MNTYTDRFGGENISPSLLDYVALTMTASVTLVWPFQTGTTTDFAAHKIDVTANGSYNLTMPDAQLVSTGQDVMIKNVGANTVTIKSADGTTIGSVASGLMWLFYLTDNSTEAGTWQSVQLGTGTSSASAASLAGLGLFAQANTLNQQAVFATKAANYAFSASDRSGSFASTGGAITFSFAAAATLTNGWFTFIRNSGSGTLTLDPSGAETIDGAATKALAIGESCIVVSDGTSALYSFGFGRSTTTTISAVAINAAGTGVYTLSATELAAQVQNYSGVLTGNRQVRIGTAPGVYFVYNNTSGAFSVTFQVNGADPGAVVAQGSYSIIRSDGTNATAAFTAAVGTVTNVATGTDLTGGPITTTGTISHDVSGVTGGTYGSSTQSLTLAINARGHITSAVANTIAAAWAAITGIPAAVTALAALTPAADKLGYFTGATTAALADLTAYGRSLIAAASAAAARTVLGLGTSAVLDTGTGANNVVQLNGSSQIPAVSGALLTNLNASALASGTVPQARVNTFAPVLLTTLTAAASASLEYTVMSNAYKSYEFRLVNILPDTNAVSLQAQVRNVGGGLYLNTNYVTGASGSHDALYLTVGFLATSTAALGGVSGSARVFNPASTTANKSWQLDTVFADSTAGALSVVDALGQWQGATSAIDAVKFFFSSGNIASGDIEVWGIP